MFYLKRRQALGPAVACILQLPYGEDGGEHRLADINGFLATVPKSPVIGSLM